MHRGLLPSLLVGSALLGLMGCTQPTSAPDPYADDVSSPWSYTAPTSRLTAQRLTPGDNNLYYERLLSALNRWGPVEIDRSNGEKAAGDGKTLTLNGKTYDRGFGTHAASELRFSLQGTNGAQCTRFTADIGVDDEVGDKGSVVFQVYLDDQKVYDSGRMTGASATKQLNLDLSGKSELRLVTTNAGDGISYDHADWARPMIACQEPRDIDLYNYRFQFDPETVSGAIGQTVTATLLVTDASSTGKLGPVSFTLEQSNTSYGGLTLAEPKRLYTATTLPARVPVQVHLTQIDPPIGWGSRILAQFRPTLEGFADPLSQRAELTWNVTAPASSGQNVWDAASWDQVTWQ